MESEISDIIAIISVILVFLTVLTDLLSKEVEVMLEKKRPLDGEDRYRAELSRDFNKIILKTVLLNISYISLLYILSPIVIGIIETSTLSFTHFDILRTLVIFFVIFLCVFLIISLRMTVNVIQKRNKLLK